MRRAAAARIARERRRTPHSRNSMVLDEILRCAQDDEEAAQVVFVLSFSLSSRQRRGRFCRSDEGSLFDGMSRPVRTGVVRGAAPNFRRRVSGIRWSDPRATAKCPRIENGRPKLRSRRNRPRRSTVSRQPQKARREPRPALPISSRSQKPKCFPRCDSLRINILRRNRPRATPARAPEPPKSRARSRCLRPHQSLGLRAKS